MTVKYICTGRTTVLPFTTIKEKGCGEVFDKLLNNGICPICKGDLRSIHVPDERSHFG